MDTLSRVLPMIGLRLGATGKGGHVITTASGASESKEEILHHSTPERVAAREHQLQQKRRQIPHTSEPLACTPEYYAKLEDRVMIACEWQGTKKMAMAPRLVRGITDPGDAVVRITSATICGSDLHMYYNAVSDGMLEGDILGHEGMGVIDEVGPGVKKFKVGDRVVISALIACGACDFCRTKRPSLCDRTNPSKRMEELYGHRLSGIFGYTQLTGGYSGSQAEFCRVPIADVNLLKVPDNLEDKQVLLLSDVLCTGWHCNEMAGVGEGDTVAIWGLGPIGLMAAYLAKTLRKAKLVIGIEGQGFRLDAARQLGIEVIDFEKQDVYETLQHLTNNHGPDCVIEAAGFRYTKSIISQLQAKVGLDSSDIPTEMIKCCAKGGRMSVIGDYFASTNAFPLGAMMEKNIQVRGGQVYVVAYWEYLLSKIVDGTIDVSSFFTHQRPLSECALAYDQFANRIDNCYKIQLITEFGQQRMQMGAGAHGFGQKEAPEVKVPEHEGPSSKK